jgi:hypothetical protein
VDQLTVRGFDAALEARLREVARSTGGSLSAAALELMRRGAGLGGERPPPRTVGKSLDHLVGTWPAEEAAEIAAALAAFAAVEEDLWR